MITRPEKYGNSRSWGGTRVPGDGKHSEEPGAAMVRTVSRGRRGSDLYSVVVLPITIPPHADFCSALRGWIGVSGSLFYGESFVFPDYRSSISASA